MINADSKKARERAAEVVAAGSIVAFRTDTFYGLGVDPFNEDALRALKELKGREEGKPILVVISNRAQVERFTAERSKTFDALSANHWPGALTIVVKARTEILDALTAGTGTIGLRLPDDDVVREFIEACGGALTATSANRAGEAPARTAVEVARSFPTGIALIVDSGSARGDSPSTVLDVSGEEPILIRAGALPKSEVERTLTALGQRLIERND